MSDRLVHLKLKWRQATRLTARYPEIVTFLVLILAFVVSANLSPYFLDLPYLFDSTSLFMEIGILALAMTLVIVSGNIDLSVASGLALVGAGVHIFGGRGRIVGVVLALFVIGFLREGMGVANISSESQLVVIGSLLLFSVALGNWMQKFR